MKTDKLKHCVNWSIRQVLRTSKRLAAISPRAYLAALLLSALIFQAVVPIAAVANSTPAARRPLAATRTTTLTPKPVPPDSTIVIYGPHRFDSTGLLTKTTDHFSLPANVFGPFTLSLQNGAADGSGRVLIGTVRLNGAVIFSSTDLNLQTPLLSQNVTIAANNTLDISFMARRSAFISISVTGSTTAATPPSITGFSPTHGAVGTDVKLTGTALTAATGSTTVTFAGSNNGPRVSALVASATATEVHATVPNGAASGTIQLSTAGGTAISSGAFTVDTTQDFKVTVAPNTASAIQRSTATQVISVTSDGPFTQLATLSTTGLPAGINIKFSPQQVTGGGISTLSLSLSNIDLSPGSYSFTVKGTATVEGKEVVHTASATLNVVLAGQTTLAGRVLSIEDEPIMGAAVSLDGHTTMTDAAGSFILSGITEGSARPLMVDGRTASAPNRSYPVITEPAVVVAGQANVIPYNFYLPPIDTQYEVDVVPNQTTVATNPRVQDLQMMIPPNANLRNRDGSPVARVSITPLNIDRTPAPLPTDVNIAIVYTSQPGGAMTDKPIPVIYPNLTGADPGTRMPLYAFNHDTVQWYVYGFGRVSSDGRTIAPEINPSTGQPYGLPDFSWHAPAPPGPGPRPKPPAGPPCTRTANPVDLSTGMKIERANYISFGGARGGLDFGHVYTDFMAQACDNCSFGRGAHHSYEYRVIPIGDDALRFASPEQLDSDGVLFSPLAGFDPGGAKIFRTLADITLEADDLARLPDQTFEYRYADKNIWKFNTSGKLTSMVDPNGNTTTLTYDGSGLLTRITDPVGRSITLTNDGTRFTSATDPLGRVWHYTYEGNPAEGTGAILTTVTDPLGGVTRYDYIRGGRLVAVTDPKGNVVKRIDYQSVSPISLLVVKETYADGGFESYSYGFSGQIITSTTVTDSLGRKMTQQYNSAGYVISQTDALGQVSKITRNINTNQPIITTGPCGCPEATREFDNRGNLTAETDRLGQTARFEYDPIFNNITKVTDKLGRATIYAYDSHGNLASITNPLGGVTQFNYDSLGQMLSATDALGHSLHFEYDSHGNTTAVIDALGNRVTSEFDLLGRETVNTDPMNRIVRKEYDSGDRLTKLTDSAGQVTTFTYDANDNLLTTTNSLNQKWTSEYDANNRETHKIDPLGRVLELQYNADGDTTSITFPSGRTTTFSYDTRGQIKTSSNLLGETVTYNYDNVGNLASLVDQRGNTTTFGYDELYRLVTQTDPLGQKGTFAYDAKGNLIETVDRLGRRTAQTYDALDHLSSINYGGAVVTNSYDALGRLIRIEDSQAGTITRSYDDAGRLLSETTPAGSVSYAYNAADQRTSMRVGNRTPINYGYDSSGRLTSITQGSATFTYSYDSLSRLVSLQRPNGVTTNFAYNAVNSIMRLTHLAPGAGIIEDYQYNYTPDDEIETVQTLGSSPTLPTAKTVASADANNRITQFGPDSFSFNAEGQTTSKSGSAGQISLSWDSRGRLVGATGDSGQVSYSYDAFGRMASRTQGGSTTTFLYDGQDVVLDQTNGGASVEYINGPGVDNKLQQASPSGTIYFLADHEGSTSALTDSAGNLVQRVQYEPFGESAGSQLTRFGYAGRERDDLTGLVFMRARWYDPRQGRFITQDPLGLVGGKNLYAYTQNDPINATDPNGLLAPLLVPVVTGAIGGAFGGGAYAFGQIAQGQPISGRDLAVATGTGAVVGAAAPFVAAAAAEAGLGAAGTFAANGLLNGVGNVVQYGLSSGNKSVGGALANFAGGFIGGGAAGVAKAQGVSASIAHARLRGIPAGQAARAAPGANARAAFENSASPSSTWKNGAGQGASSDIGAALDPGASADDSNSNNNRPTPMPGPPPGSLGGGSNGRGGGKGKGGGTGGGTRGGGSIFGPGSSRKACFRGHV